MIKERGSVVAVPLYEYKAYNYSGNTVSGLLEAQSRRNAYEKLKAKALFPKEITPDSKKISKSAITADSLSFALTQLSSLLRAGIPIVRALESIVSQVESKDMGRALVRIKTLIQEGKSFAGALEQEAVFPPLLARMAAAGESVGNLDSILERYASFLEKESESSKKLAGAMIYPSVVIVACTVLILFVLSYITPTLIDIFDSFGRELPVATKVLVSFGLFLKGNVLWILLIAAACAVAFVRFVPKRVKDDLKLSMPFVGQAYRMAMYARWARTLGLLHGGGVSLIKALEYARSVLDNERLEKELESAERDVEKGKSLAVSLNRFFPSLVVNMIETGQQTGELERMMYAAADFYEKESDRKTTLFLRLFEPAMIISLGLLVGFIVISVLLPIFEINSLVK